MDTQMQIYTDVLTEYQFQIWRHFFIIYSTKNTNQQHGLKWGADENGLDYPIFNWTYSSY